MERDTEFRAFVASSRGRLLRTARLLAGGDAYWALKYRATGPSKSDEKPDYEAIEIPRNSATGFVCAFFATVMGFALIWHIWWLVAAGAVGAFATFVVFAWRDHEEDVVPAREVARIDRNNRAQRHAVLGKILANGIPSKEAAE